VTAPAPKLSDEAFRASVVGASEVAALFDASPWLTHFELWHRKVGTIATPEFNAVIDGQPENERAYFGVKLEPAIIEAACERWGYVPTETPKRLNNGKGLGGHPDQCVICPERGPGILEVKMADWLVRKDWGDEPPLHYLLQSQTYQGLAKVAWGDVIVLVGGNKLERFQYEFRPKVYADIEARVSAFWASVAANKPPKADYSKDGRAIAEIYGNPADTMIDMRLDNRMPDLLAEFLLAREAEVLAGARVDACKAEIMEKLGDHTEALVDGYGCRAPVVKGKPDTEITADMIGQTIRGRASYRRLTVKVRDK
jgi:predicted phage-related endonuclease